MATSDRIQAASNISSKYTLRVDWSRISVDINLNKERVGVNCYVFRNDGYTGSESAWTANANERRTTLTVNGVPQSATGAFDTRYGKIANVGYFEFDIPHDTDGNKTASVSFDFYSNVGSVLDGTSTISGSMVLDRIPREAIFAQINDFNIGDSAILSVSNSGGLYANLAIKHDSTELVSAEGVLNGQIKLDIAGSVLYPLTPNSNTLALTVELKTYAAFGGSQIGSTQTGTINARVTNSDPIYDDISVYLENYLNNVVSIVNEYSSATITVIDAIGQNSATISKVSVTCGSVTAESNSPSFDDTWVVVTESIESDSYTVVVTDSRGNSVVYSGTFSNIYRGYKKPYVDSVSLVRDQLINAETLLNCVLKIDTNPRVLGIISSEMDNAPKSVYYSYKETTSSTWSSVTIYASDECYESGKGDIPAPPEMTISGNTVTITDLELSFDTTKQYDFRVGLTDWLDSGYQQIELDSAEPVRCEVMTSEGGVTGFNMVPTITGAGGAQSRYGFFDVDGTNILDLMPVLPTQRVKAYHNTSQSIPNSSDTLLSCNSEYYDTDGMHSTSSNTGRITFNTAGVYLVVLSGSFANNTTNTREMWVKGSIKGSTYYSQRIDSPGVVTRDTGMHMVDILDVNAGDYIDAYTWQGSGGALTLYSVNFMATRIQ